MRDHSVNPTPESAFLKTPHGEVETGQARACLANVTWLSHVSWMDLRERWLALSKIQAVRTCLFITGLLLMLVSPALGVLPGPGGIVVFAAGLALTLKYSEWAKRKYVAFKRQHPRKGAWADWGLRRSSARRREALRKEQDESRGQG
jgi:hypothetical protein